MLTTLSQAPVSDKDEVPVGRSCQDLSQDDNREYNSFLTVTIMIMNICLLCIACVKKGTFILETNQLHIGKLHIFVCRDQIRKGAALNLHTCGFKNEVSEKLFVDPTLALQLYKTPCSPRTAPSSGLRLCMTGALVGVDALASSP